MRRELIAVAALSAAWAPGIGAGEQRRADVEKLTPILVRGLRYGHGKVRASALGVLLSLDRPVEGTRPALLAILRNKSGEETRALRVSAGRALAAFGRPGVPDVLALAGQGDKESLALLFEGLNGKGPGPKEIVRDLLTGSNEELRLKAHGSLGTLGPGAVPHLSKALSRNDVRALSAGLDGLADAELGPQAVPVLVGVLQMGKAGPRDQAAGILAAMGPAAGPALRALRKLAREGESFGRLPAARAIWRIGRESGPALRAASSLLGPMPPEGGAAPYRLRAQAVALLGELGPAARRALPLLVAALREEPHHGAIEVKIEVLSVLPKLGPETMDHVLPFLGDPNAQLRRAAVAAVADYGPEAEVPATPLFALLKDKDTRTRKHAACALAKARGIPSHAISVLSKAMKAERDHETLEGLGGALSRMGRPGRAALLEILKCPNHLARWKASRALGKLGIDVFDDLAAMLEPTRAVPKGQVGPKYYYRVVAGAMGMMGPDVVPRVKGWLKAEDRYKKEIAVGVLSTIRPEGIDLLRPMIEAEQSSATYYLLKNNLWRPGLDRPRMLALYLDLAADPSRKVRLLAAARLSALTWKEGGAEAVPVLVGLLRDRDPKVREHIVNALGKIREGRDVSSPALIRRTRDLVPAVRVAACKALRYESDGGACLAMVSALFRERDAKLRLEIARWGFARKYWAIPRLLEVIRGPDAKKRGLAAVALRSVGPLAVVVFMDLFESEDPELREIAVDGLKVMGDLAAPALLEMINRP